MGTHGGTEEDRVRARSAINQKIRSGKVPDPNDVPCADCGHEYNGKDGIRHEYDHYKGYSEDHALDVKSVCTDCHKRRSLKEYGRLSAMTAITYPTRTCCGIPVTVDRPRGFIQRGVAPDGTPWERTYAVDYGYIAGTLGGDGDALDAFCGKNNDAPTAWWIYQIKADGTFDEFKVLLGFTTEAEALACYQQHTPAQYIGSVFQMPVAAVKALICIDPVSRLSMLSTLAAK
jgi:hypothetical protein